MNLIYIHSHDTGRFIEPYGYPVPTPGLMRLAQEGTLFRQAYCAAPTCSASRAAMLTGTSAHTSGVTGLVHRGFALKDNSRHLAQYLKAAGYDTVLCGVQHETAANPQELGYNHVFTDHPYQQADFERIDYKSTDDAINFLRQNQEQPFFLSLGLVNTHRDFPVVEKPTNPDYILVPPTLPDFPETRKDFAGFIDSAKILDACCQRLFECLDQEQLWEDTIVLFTTDHGIAFPKMKCSLYDTGIGVSLILKFPGNPGARTVSDALVSHLDVYPTLCDLLGLDKPDWLEGQSLIPLLNNQQEQIREAVFAEVSYHAAYEPMRCVRTTQYKFIQRFDDYPTTILCNIDDGGSKDLLLSHKLRDTPSETLMLFDLINDPLEQNNLAYQPEYQDALTQMRIRLADWMTRTNDPLLSGSVPKPTKARINYQDCVSNTEQNYE